MQTDLADKVQALADHLRNMDSGSGEAKLLSSVAFELRKITPGMWALVNERHRQVMEETWDDAHDDEHGRGELSAAAAAYALAASEREGNIIGSTRYQEAPPGWWPWALRWWKPKNARRELEKAGALIGAELDRLIRAAARNRSQ